VLEWRESGGPTVVPPTRKGFGQVVCQAMVERSIGGRATLLHEPEGVVWAFATDARRALAA
jgi:two-component sensor histidine kinase